MKIQDLRKIFFILGLAIAFLALAWCSIASASGTGPSKSWWVLGGGGAASGGNATLDVTLGQPTVGFFRSGSLSLGAGYWYEEQLTQLFFPFVRR
jgi:hypothetical protein